MKQTVLFILIHFVLISCKKEITSSYKERGEGRIIGHHPCRNFISHNKVAGAGFVIEINKGTTMDTVVTYDIPENLLEFQSSYIDGSYSYFLFRPEVQNLFNIKFNYKIADEGEREPVLCNGLIFTAPYNAAVQGREILMSNIEKK